MATESNGKRDPHRRLIRFTRLAIHQGRLHWEVALVEMVHGERVLRSREFIPCRVSLAFVLAALHLKRGEG